MLSVTGIQIIKLICCHGLHADLCLSDVLPKTLNQHQSYKFICLGFLSGKADKLETLILIIFNSALQRFCSQEELNSCMFLIHVHDNLLNEHFVLSFASRTQPWHTAPIMTSGKYHSFFPFFFSFYLNLVLVVQHLRAYIRLFLSRYALYKKTKYKQGKSHSGRCEKQFSIPALCSSPPPPPMLCHKALVFLSAVQGHLLFYPSASSRCFSKGDTATSTPNQQKSPNSN